MSENLKLEPWSQTLRELFNMVGCAIHVVPYRAAQAEPLFEDPSLARLPGYLRRYDAVFGSPDAMEPSTCPTLPFPPPHVVGRRLLSNEDDFQLSMPSTYTSHSETYGLYLAVSGTSWRCWYVPGLCPPCCQQIEGRCW